MHISHLGAPPNLPHSGAKLDKTTVTVSNCNYHIRFLDTACAQVNKRQDESGQGKSTKSEWRWVSNTLCRRAIETWLEFSTESLQAESGVVGRNVSERVTAIVVRSASGSVVVDGTRAIRVLFGTSNPAGILNVEFD